MDVPDVGANGKFDRTCPQFIRRRRSSDPAGVCLACVLRNGALLIDGTGGKQIAHAPGKRGEILGIVRLPPFSRARLCQAARVGVRQAFLFRPGERVLFDQHALPLVALTGTAEANDYGTERRVAAGPSGERCISAFKKRQAIEIGTSQAQRPFCLHAKKAALAKFLATLRTGRVTDDPENDNLVWP
jgi:hypothetical protein